MRASEWGPKGWVRVSICVCVCPGVQRAQPPTGHSGKIWTENLPAGGGWVGAGTSLSRSCRSRLLSHCNMLQSWGHSVSLLLPEELYLQRNGWTLLAWRQPTRFPARVQAAPREEKQGPQPILADRGFPLSRRAS